MGKELATQAPESEPWEPTEMLSLRVPTEWEVETEDSPEACSPANLEHSVHSKRACLKQGRR